MRKGILSLLFFGIFHILMAQQTINKSITHDGQTREYTVFLPTGYTTSSSLPMVINMHGLSSNAFEQTFYSAFSPLADTAGFIVVYPQGLSVTLNGQTATHWNANFGSTVDDIGFIDTLIDYMYTDYNVDLSKVYATGMSNGGFMSYMLACQLSDRIAAIASVTGAMSFPQMALCNPAQPTPIMQIHGTADSTVLYGGEALFYPDIPTGVNWWVNFNNCQNSTTTAIADTSTTDSCTAELTIHDQCNSNVEVHFYKITDGGHTWPGAFHSPLFGLGNTNQDFWASEAIWAFFSQYQHPNPRMGTILSTANKLSENIVNLYPNPFSSQVTVEVETTNLEQLRLMDMTGKTLQIWNNITANNRTISTAHLANGVYWLQVVTASGSITKKLIKQ